MKIAKGIQISKPPILLPFLSSQSHKMHSNTQSADLCDGRGSLPVLVDIEDSLPNLPPIYTNPQSSISSNSDNDIPLIPKIIIKSKHKF